MIGDKMLGAINDQIAKELYSAYLYQAMSAWASGQDLDGVANWLQVQAQEEVSHAMKFYRFVLERGGKIELQAIDAPPADFDSAQDIFQKTLDHEKKVTASIDNLVNIAQQERDHASSIMLQWFVTEQVEEEASAEAILNKLKMVGDKGNGLFMIDRELAQRTFTPPAEEGAE
jgi:ferritin